jgi:hypothetical protein
MPGWPWHAQQRTSEQYLKSPYTVSTTSGNGFQQHPFCSALLPHLNQVTWPLTARVTCPQSLTNTCRDQVLQGPKHLATAENVPPGRT